MLRTLVGALRLPAMATAVGLLALLLTASAANAETLLMPPRDFLMSANEVVWGVTTQANGTAYTIDFGDGSLPVAGVVADRSYIAFNHTYALSGTFNVSLTVGAEVATVAVDVYNPATLTAYDLRGLNINRAIQDGLRYLYVAQGNRAANFPSGLLTEWGTFPITATGLVVQAFQNHGYVLSNNDSMPAGIYEKYVVRRGLNFIADRVVQLTLTVQTAGNPCVGAGVEAAPCIGLQSTDNNDPGYATAIAALAIAGSNSLARHVEAGVPGVNNAGFVVGKTYGEILQRLMNSISFGQNDAGNGRGGWSYGFNAGASDGSTVGWDVLALLDGAAAGATIPAFVKTEFNTTAFPNHLNTDGSFDYQADTNAGGDFTLGHSTARAGIGIQGANYVGRPVGDPYVVAAQTYIKNRWTANSDAYYCFNNGRHNKGCGYTMFNVFKGLKLFGVTTLPGIGRPAGPGPIPADDWYADYEDYLVANQTSSLTNSLDGNWAEAVMSFSCCGTNNNMSNALAVLILAPVALIQPDPTLFSTVGLAPAVANGIVGGNHTVTATATSSGGAAVPGATINFVVLTGPNAGKNFVGVTNASGQVSFSYADTGGAPGVDTIQASIGNLDSNIVSMTWGALVIKCDADGDRDVDAADLVIIRAANRQAASGVNDPRDGNGDGVINVADVRFCQLVIKNNAAAAKAALRAARVAR